jgi:basic amino acid/polyamine antiporter, APA family
LSVRKLSLTDSVFIGLAAMLGAGVFIVFGPAAELAGSALPVAIVLAALVAFLNAGSVAQLATQVTRSGGGYAYARVYISRNFSFLAGASFIVGKIGSSAAIALTVGAYASNNHAIPIAVGAVVIMTLINLAGINRTAFGSKVLAIITLSFLSILFLSALAIPSSTDYLSVGNPVSVFSAAALFFFAFAGYARIATLGGEVRDPAKTVPKVIWLSLAMVLVVYLALSILLVDKLGSALPLTVTPLADLADKTWIGGELVWVFTAIAGLGSLLALLAGISRTGSEMALDRELPKFFSKKLKNGTPYVAEITVAILIVSLVLSGSVLISLSISSFAVLLYYAIVNFSAFRQPAAESARPKILNLLGVALCLLLALSVPLEGLVAAVIVLGTAMLLRWGLRVLR